MFFIYSIHRIQQQYLLCVYMHSVKVSVQLLFGVKITCNFAVE